MRTLALVALVCGVLSTREATAQSFSYVPPGYGYGDYYGIDLGNGVGFGYGIGVGVPVSPSLLNSSKTDTYIPPFQELCDCNPSFITRGAVAPSAPPVLPSPPKTKMKLPTTKKNASKVTPAKAKSAKQAANK